MTVLLLPVKKEMYPLSTAAFTRATAWNRLNLPTRCNLKFPAYGGNSWRQCLQPRVLRSCWLF